MRKTREEKAITLIALIITIVVLLILAVVAINAVTGDGIIQHATNARDDYEKAQSEESDILSYYQEYLDAQGDLGPWKQEGDNITMKDKEGNTINIPIGAIVNYNPTEGLSTTEISNLTYTSSSDKTGIAENQTFGVTSYTGDTATWQVLGIENGKILLISTNNVIESYYLAGKEGFRNSITELDAISSIYGHGKGAESARSIKVEDINKITKYNPAETIRNQGKVNEYGNKVEYSFNAEGKIEYTSTNNANGTSSYTKFIYWDDAISDYEELNSEDEVEIMSNNNGYDDRAATNKLIEGSTIDKLLFGEKEYDSTQDAIVYNRTYWLSSRCLITYEGYVGHAIQLINIGRVRVINAYTSNGGEVGAGEYYRNTPCGKIKIKCNLKRK